MGIIGREGSLLCIGGGVTVMVEIRVSWPSLGDHHPMMIIGRVYLGDFCRRSIMEIFGGGWLW
jgi:hypothetical protein